MMQWPPTMDSSQPRGFMENLRSASGTTGVTINTPKIAGSNNPFTDVGPQEDANSNFLNGMWGPWPRGANNPILIECQKARQDQTYRDVANLIKPPYTIMTLIAMAIENSHAKKATVAEIYQFIKDLFPFYEQHTRKWQNTVRHTLTTEDCFIKNDRPHGYSGTGKFWSLHPDSVKSFANGQFCWKRVVEDKAKAKGPRMDPTLGAQGLMDQIQSLGKRNTHVETETTTQDPGMTLPAAFASTIPVNAGPFSQHQTRYVLAPQTPKFSSTMALPVQTAALLSQYSRQHTTTHTNGYPFHSQHNQAQEDHQRHNHNRSGGYNEFRLGFTDNNEHRFESQIPSGENSSTHLSATAYTGQYPNSNDTNNILNNSSTSSATAGPTGDETWDFNNLNNPLSSSPSMPTATTDQNSENTDQQRYTDPLCHLTGLLGYTDQWFKDIYTSSRLD